MKGMYSFIKIIGILLIITGIALIVIAVFFPEAASGLFITGAVLIIVGIIDFALGNYFGKLFKDFPKLQGFNGSMKASGKRMSSMAEFMKQQNKMNELSSKGIPVRVKIISFKDTGEIINYDSVFEFQLEVLKEHRYDNYYINNHRQIVSKVIASRIKTGNEYPAKVDPENRENIILSWL